MPPLGPPSNLLTTTTAGITLSLTLLTTIYISSHLGPNSPSSHAKILSSKADPKNKIYPLDTFPGNRTVSTAHGNLHVYEWGPPEGEQVLFLQGIGTPSVGYRDLLEGLVERGYRVMTFDYYGRGHSSSPHNIPHNPALYDHAILSAITSSAIPWSNFHLMGYSLGGTLGTTFATHHPSLLLSLTLICSGGLVRSATQLTFLDRLLYGDILPGWLGRWWMARRLDPGKPGEGVVEYQANEDEEEDQVDLMRKKRALPEWDNLIRWQMNTNPGFVESYLSTFQHAPIYDQHNTIFTTLAHILKQRRTSNDEHQGLPGGKVIIFLGKTDPYVPVDECIEDAERVLGKEACVFHVLEGGHEIGIQNGREIAELAVQSWKDLKG